jgi:hypothetical protein
MLRAIDWALTPDENQRPLRVADFRRACLPRGWRCAALAGAPRGPAATPAARRHLAGRGLQLHRCRPVRRRGCRRQPTPADEAAHQEQRSLLATIVSQAVATVPASSRLAANTREGCAVCYVGDPEDALRTATLLGASASERGLGLQIGINLGPVLVQPAPSGRSRLLGDGVATAFRVMRLSEPGQVLVTRAYVELIAQLGRSASACFSLLGQRRDPQDREHDLYHYTGDSQMAASSHPVSGGHLSPTGSDISLEVADAAERLLTRHIGPLARILVRKTLPRAASREELHRLLAAMIPDPAARAAFLAGVMLPAQPHSTGAGPNSARQRLRLCTRRRVAFGAGDCRSFRAADRCAAFRRRPRSHWQALCPLHRPDGQGAAAPRGQPGRRPRCPLPGTGQAHRSRRAAAGFPQGGGRRLNAGDTGGAKVLTACHAATAGPATAGPNRRTRLRARPRPSSSRCREPVGIRHSAPDVPGATPRSPRSHSHPQDLKP